MKMERQPLIVRFIDNPTSVETPFGKSELLDVDGENSQATMEHHTVLK